MGERFIAVADEAGLDRLFASSQREPVVLFLRDPNGGDGDVEQEMARLSAPVHVVDVVHQRALSRRIAERTGIHEESPLAFVLHTGQVVWSRSHDAITATAVRQALRQCAVPAR